MNEPIVLKLIKSVTAYDATLTELKFREPNGEDIEKAGYPLKITGDSGAIPIAESISKLIVRLASVPPSTVKSLCVADYQAALGVVLSFFGQVSDSSETIS